MLDHDAKDPNNKDESKFHIAILKREKFILLKLTMSLFTLHTASLQYDEIFYSLSPLLPFLIIAYLTRDSPSMPSND
jgi:uncharacterized membrane protein